MTDLQLALLEAEIDQACCEVLALVDDIAALRLRVRGKIEALRRPVRARGKDQWRASTRAKGER